MQNLVVHFYKNYYPAVVESRTVAPVFDKEDVFSELIERKYNLSLRICFDFSFSDVLTLSFSFHIHFKTCLRFN